MAVFSLLGVPGQLHSFPGLAPGSIWFCNPWARWWKDYIISDIWRDSQICTEYSHIRLLFKGKGRRGAWEGHISKHWEFKRHSGTLSRVLLIPIRTHLQIEPLRSVQEIFTLWELKAEVPPGAVSSLWSCDQAGLANQLYHWKPSVNKQVPGVARGVSDLKELVTNTIAPILPKSQTQISRCLQRWR